MLFYIESGAGHMYGVAMAKRREFNYECYAAMCLWTLAISRDTEGVEKLKRKFSVTLGNSTLLQCVHS